MHFSPGIILCNRTLQTTRSIYSLNSSSSIKNNSTTFKKHVFEIDRPAFGYWEHNGLTKKQFQLWMNTAKCDEDCMLRYLSYCRFDMVDPSLEESKPIDNVFNWFFKILERTGGYPKPKGYKSFEEKQLETERNEVEAKEKLARQQQELYKRKIKAERDAEFYKMLNNPESKTYKKCFEMLNDFTKKRIGKKSFEVGMHANFDKLMEED